RQVRNDGAGVENHLLGVAVLHRRAVKSEADAEIVRIGQFVGGYQDRPGWGKGVKRLADHPLLLVLFELPVTSRHVVADGIARDVASGRLGVEVSSSLA